MHGETTLPGAEGVVEDVAGPDEDGTAWCVTLRIDDVAGGDTLALFPEAALEPTGFAENETGERIALTDRPAPEERRDRLQLRLATAITDNIVAARVAEEIEQELHDLIGGGRIEIEAERHWADPYNYELEVTVEPLDDPTEALRQVAEAGGAGWISCRDDGWRCDLWWCASDDADTVLLAPEVRGAEVSFLPWRSPRRRPEAERPLVTVHVPAALEEPAVELDDEAGDEEA